MDKVEWQQGSRAAASLSIDGPASSTRGHRYKMEREVAKTNARHNFFINRRVDDWNRLEEQTVNAKSVASFRRMLGIEMTKRLEQ